MRPTHYYVVYINPKTGHQHESKAIAHRDVARAERKARIAEGMEKVRIVSGWGK